MTVLTFPAGLKPSSAEFGLISNVQAFTSPLAGTVQTAELPGARWRVAMKFTVLDENQGRALKSFLAALDGLAGRFYYGDPAFLIKGAAGALGGTPLVAGASQTGTSIDIDGASSSVTNWIRAGDYIQFTNTAGERELKMITADADTDGAGAATLSFKPAIRVSPADNAPITVTGATCQMMLAGNTNNWRLSPPMFTDISIEAIEAFTS